MPLFHLQFEESIISIQSNLCDTAFHRELSIQGLVCVNTGEFSASAHLHSVGYGVMFTFPQV